MKRRILQAALLATLALPAAADGSEEPLRIAWIGPLTGPLAKAGEESLLGAQIAAETAAGARPIEVLSADDREDPKAVEAAFEQARKKKCVAILCMATSLTLDAVQREARSGKAPVILVGAAAPTPTIEEDDPLLFVGPWPVDEALNMTSFLHLHSEKSGLGLYRDCSKPAIVAEDSPRGRELADALARNMGPRQQLCEKVFAPPHGAPSKADLLALRDAKCDRLVLAGEPDLLDRTAEAMKPLGFDVPFYCADGMLSRASIAAHDGTVRRANFITGWPTIAQLKGEMGSDQRLNRNPASALQAALAKRPGSVLYPRTRAAWFAGWMVAEALGKRRASSTKEGPKTLLGQIRALAYDFDEERERPYLDETGRTALYQWFVWTMGEKGPEMVKPSFLPTRDRGPFLRMKQAGDFDRVEINDETKIVWVTFGEPEPGEKGEKGAGRGKKKSEYPRTIEEDMGALGLGTRGYEADLDPWLLDELLARAIGKMNGLFLKNYDGTFIPDVSFNVHFTTKKPDVKVFRTMLIAAEMSWDPKIDKPTEADPGGVCKGLDVFVFSRWMRYWTAIRDKALKPKMNRDDKQYLDGTYSWGTTWEQNMRSDDIRCVVDGYSSWFSMTGAHELGHSFGLGHDVESKRSLMNVVDAVGLGDKQACWIPPHVKILDGTIGRYPGKKKRM